MPQLENNQELYDYLISLAASLRERGAESMAVIITAASKHAAGLSTEFLGESRIALRKLVDLDPAVLGEQGKSEVADVLKQLNAALDRRQQ